MSTATRPETIHEPPTDAAGLVVDAKRRRLVLIAMCTALVAVVASVSGLNVAQGQLALDLGATQSQLLWVINGYTIALAALLLPIGAVGDRWGRKHVLVAGLSLFVGANIAAALATSVTQLLVFRVAGGVSAAMIMPITLSVITSTFPAEERDRAVGVWAGFAGAGGVLGLVSSSIVVDNFTWPWVFAGPIVIAAIALAMSIRVVPQSRESHEGRFDVLGSILSAVAVGGLVLAVHEGPEVGWSDPLTVIGLTAGILGTAWFAWWELRTEQPLLDIRVFRHRTLTASSVTLLAVFAVMMGLFLVLVQYLQAVLGYSAIKASMGLMPLAVVLLPLSAVAPLIARRVGLRAMLVGGLGLVALGLAMMASMASISGGYLSVLPGLLVLGVGAGLAQTPATSGITGSLPVEEQGVASALNDTVREFGGAMGIALIGSALSAGYRSGVSGAADHLSPQAGTAVREGIGGAAAIAGKLGPQGQQVMDTARGAFVDGLGHAMWLAAGMSVIAAIFALVWLPRQGTATAESPTAELDASEAALDAEGFDVEALVPQPVA
ncbi:MFS transporter [Aquihabitans sp. McL0605]|uniref:MFS transporter n=1 Tax=Aquihabitans sp. McL0605 TaxID=3415671 RepID=UPI003CF421D8